MKRILPVIVTWLCAATLGVGASCGDEPPTKAKNRQVPSRESGPAALGLSRTGKSRFGWTWLAGRFDKNHDDAIVAAEWNAAQDVFTRLDRNWDGRLTAADFDWSPGGDLGRQRDATFALFKALDEDSDGQLTSREWQTAFAKIAGDKEYMNDEGLEELIYRPAAQRNRSMRQTNFLEMAPRYDWAKAAPAPGDAAPDFTLRTPTGEATVKLSSFRGDKPVVLIFGSFS